MIRRPADAAERAARLVVDQVLPVAQFDATLGNGSRRTRIMHARTASRLR